MFSYMQPQNRCPLSPVARRACVWWQCLALTVVVSNEEANRGRGRGTPGEGGTFRRGLELYFSTIPMTYHPSPSGSFHTTFSQCLWKVLTNLWKLLTAHEHCTFAQSRVWQPWLCLRARGAGLSLPCCETFLESHLISLGLSVHISKNGYSNVWGR